MKLATRFYLKVFFASIAIIAGMVTFAYSANVTLRWDANLPAPEGYRVFAREGSQSYDYSNPIWQNNLTTCTLTGLTEGTTYHFVVRAFDGSLESADSEEVDYTPLAVNAGDTSHNTTTRFTSERQSAGPENHTNIACVDDAGATVRRNRGTALCPPICACPSSETVTGVRSALLSWVLLSSTKRGADPGRRAPRLAP